MRLSVAAIYDYYLICHVLIEHDIIRAIHTRSYNLEQRYTTHTRPTLGCKSVNMVWTAVEGYIL